MSPEELKALRLERGWRLRDVANPLGVTTATLSRWERGLQVPSHGMLGAWERLVTRQTSAGTVERRARRRPRGAVPRLAELFLADVKAGLNGWQAGWRELSELGLVREDVPSLERDIEMDVQGRVRIRFESRLEAVEEGKAILGYRKTLRDEERRLLPAFDELIRPLLEALQAPRNRGVILLSGLTEMVSASALQVQSSRNLLDGDAGALVEAPVGAAMHILEALEIRFPSDVSAVSAALRRLHFEDLTPPGRASTVIAEARAIAEELGLGRTAKRLGPDPVKAVGAAWAVSRRLACAGIGIMTDEGARQLSDVFWDWLGTSRVAVDAAWRRVMIEEFEPQTEKEQLQMLLWSWPEVF